jgi:hypothetical protein
MANEAVGAAPLPLRLLPSLLQLRLRLRAHSSEVQCIQQMES